MKRVLLTQNLAKMKMNFNTELPLGKMLFVGWDVETRPDLAWTCIVLGLASVAYEGLKVAKSTLHARRYVLTRDIRLDLTYIYQTRAYGLVDTKHVH